MSGLYVGMDRFELRALELEMEQRHRHQAQGSHSDFWNSRYEQMQLYLIRRYRSLSSTWRGPLVCGEVTQEGAIRV